MFMLDGEVYNPRNLGSKLNKQLARNVESMIADGTLNLVSLCATVLGKVVEKNSVKQLKDHFIAAGKQPCDINIGREYWAGEPEIKTFVEWVDEPVYSIDVMEDGDAFPQWYRMVDVRRPDGTSSRRAIVSAVSPASFRAHMDVYRRNQVVPLVILLHHAEVRGRAAGHFTAARVSNETYKHWAGTKRLQSAMKERLVKVQRVLPFMDHDLTQYVSFPPSPPHTPGEGSVYEPSSNNSSIPESARSSSANSAGAKDEDSPMSSSEQPNVDSTSAGANRDSNSQRHDQTPSTPSFTLLQGDSTSASRQASSLPSSIFSILANDSQPALTPEIFPRPRHSSQSSQTLPSAGMKEEELIIQLRARPPYGDEIARQVRRTYNSNTTAFDTWRGRQRKENPTVYDSIKTAQGPIRATEQLQEHIGALIELIQALPYPEIHVATISEEVLKRAGQTAICVANAQLLHRVYDSLPSTSQDFCHTWLEALTAPRVTMDTRWGLAVAADRWDRLEKAAAKKRISLPARSRHGIDENAWCKLIAYLLIVPGCLPWEFTDCPVPQRCDALLVWLADSANAEIASLTAAAIHERDWLAARRLFPAPSDGGLNSEQAATHLRAQLGSAAAPLQY